MSKVLERADADRRPPTPAPKLPSRFVTNLLNKKMITAAEAEILNQLSTPHQQFEALKRYRAAPHDGLSAHVNAVKQAQVEADAAIDPLSPSSFKAFAHFMWQIAAQQRVSRSTVNWIVACISGLAMIALAWNVAPKAASWWIQRHGEASLTAPEKTSTPAAVPAAPANAPAPPATPAPAPATPTAHHTAAATAAPANPAPVKLPAPRNFAAHPSNNQMLQLTWDSLGDGVTYHLYSSANQNMQDAQSEDDAPIPVNWYNWMPPADGSYVWLAVKGIGHNGKLTAFSNAIRIDLPVGTVAPATPAPAAQPQP